MTDNGKDKIVPVDATDLAQDYYAEYSQYVLEYRALPSIYDGLKPVQRRIIYTANKLPKKLMKTAELAGLVMALHPHGDASIVGAINDMACSTNALPLFETKGNFGGNGLEASAPRYTQCYLSEVARYIFCQFTDYADYEDGELDIPEPSALPSLLPYSFIRGSEGIAVGMATKVMPLNLLDLINYYIDYIKNDGKSTKLVRPDIGPVQIKMKSKEIKKAVNNNKSKITASPIVKRDGRQVIINGLFGVTLDNVLNKLDKKYNYFSSGKVGFMDATSTEVQYVFEVYSKTVKVETFIAHLIEAATGSKTYCRIVEMDGSALYASMQDVIQVSLDYLNKAIDKKLIAEREKITKQLELYEVLEKCKAKHVFDKIACMDHTELVDKIVATSGCSEELAKEIIKKPISYLTKSHISEADDLRAALDMLNTHDRKEYLLDMYNTLKKMVMPIYKNKKHTEFIEEE